MSQKIHIGQFGFGTVGQGFYKILNQSNQQQFSVKKIAIKNVEKERLLDVALFTTEKNDILKDPSISLVLELIDDSEAAFEIVSQALRNGKDVISANKKMIAEHFSELQQLQKETGQRLLYEAAVAGSIPVLQTINNFHSTSGIQSITAILNGSSNFILSQIVAQKWTYQKALSVAQQNGFAESDPSLDVGGYDARYKLSLLNNFAFGQHIKPDEIPLTGIDNLQPIDFDFAESKRGIIKPIGIQCEAVKR